VRELKRSDTVYSLRYAILSEVFHVDHPLKMPHSVYENPPNKDRFIGGRDGAIGTPLDDRVGRHRDGAKNLDQIEASRISGTGATPKKLGRSADMNRKKPESHCGLLQGVYGSTGSYPSGDERATNLAAKEKKRDCYPWCLHTGG
jgi:hypothetical protein